MPRPGAAAASLAGRGSSRRFWAACSLWLNINGLKALDRNAPSYPLFNLEGEPTIEKRLEDQATRLAFAARDLLRARILQRYRSMLQFDRAIGDPPGTVNQRVRRSATIRLKVEEMTRYLVFLELDPGDFWSEAADSLRPPPRPLDGRPRRADHGSRAGRRRAGPRVHAADGARTPPRPAVTSLGAPGPSKGEFSPRIASRPLRTRVFGATSLLDPSDCELWAETRLPSPRNTNLR